MTTGIVAMTADYEWWLGERIPLVQADLHAKHEEMAASELRFLRGTYYFWLRRFAELCPELLAVPQVPGVGDAHVENFGTWLDHREVRRWGVNDLDELAWGAYAIDLVRLATSVTLLPGFPLSRKAICTALLDGWTSAKPGRAVDLSREAAAHLRRLVPPASSAKRFYRELTSSENGVDVPERVRDAVLATGPPGWKPSWHARRAGTGSLGHPRVVAVGPDATGATVAREAKLLGPATVSWLDGLSGIPEVDALLYGRVEHALAGPYPSRRVHGWQLRRLAPDVVRIDVTALRPRGIELVLRSMASALADVHAADPRALHAARADARTRGGDWLREAVGVMATDTQHAHAEWARR